VTRLRRLRGSLDVPLLVSNPVNIRYLTGFESSNAALLVGLDDVRLFADFRYANAARAVADVDFVETGRDLYRDLARLLDGRIGFEPDHLTVARHGQLAEGRLDLVPTGGLVERLRALKDEQELEAIRRAATITSEAFARLSEERFVGRSERELARLLERTWIDLGADGPAFTVIVAAGRNGANPHARPGDRPIEPGTLVVVDFGARLDGYQSDCTRTFATGPLPDDLHGVYDLCLQAQQRALSAVRAGAACADVDGVARDVISAAGYGERFGHGLGHGLGLEVHEAPYLRQESTETLAAGNVVTVEPGIYLGGRAGVRIEDLAIVTDDGPEVLTTFTKELVVVG